MDKPIINLETLNDKINNIVASVNARDKSYMKNFALINERFLKIDEMMKIQNSMNERIRGLEGLFEAHGLQLAEEIRTKPPPSGMYMGGYKTRKSVNKRRKTSKRK
jgi:hypothetical protein